MYVQQRDIMAKTHPTPRGTGEGEKKKKDQPKIA
jgi:hypothetical protein